MLFVRNCMIQSARSMWAARSAGVALSSRRREMRMSRCGKVKIFCCQSLKASMSGKTMIFLPLRELRRSDVSPDLPPVASHRYWGIIAEQMMAVFSDSTRAMVLSGCWGRRCSPKRHWVSCQSGGSCFLLLSIEWSQLILPGLLGSLILWPVAGLYCMIFPVRHWLSWSICRKMIAWSGVEARR